MNSTPSHHRLLPGLAEPVFDGQRVFRAALEAFSHPGRAVSLPIDLDPPAPLAPASAAFLLAMADLETPLWLQDANPAVEAYMRFHCGAPVVGRHRDARFALVTEPAAMPDLDRFDPGEPQYPDRSATVLIQLHHLQRGTAVRLRGPGIKDAAVLDLAGLKADFWAQWKRNDALFPCGVDVLFTCGNLLYALPRTAKAEV